MGIPRLHLNLRMKRLFRYRNIRLSGVYAHSLYMWLRVIKPDNSKQHAQHLFEAKREILKLRAQSKRTEEKRALRIDIQLRRPSFP